MAKKCYRKNLLLTLFLIAAFLVLGLGLSINPIQKYRGPRYKKEDVLLNRDIDKGDYIRSEDFHK